MNRIHINDASDDSDVGSISEKGEVEEEDEDDQDEDQDDQDEDDQDEDQDEDQDDEADQADQDEQDDQDEDDQDEDDQDEEIENDKRSHKYTVIPGLRNHFLQPSLQHQLREKDIRSIYSKLGVRHLEALSIIQQHAIRSIYKTAYKIINGGHFDSRSLLFKTVNLLKLIRHKTAIEISELLQDTWHGLLDNHSINENFFDTIIFVFTSTFLQLITIVRTQQRYRRPVIAAARRYLSDSPYLLATKSEFDKECKKLIESGYKKVGFGHFRSEISLLNLDELLRPGRPKPIRPIIIHDADADDDEKQIHTISENRKSNQKKKKKSIDEEYLNSIQEEIESGNRGYTSLDDEDSIQFKSYEKGTQVWAQFMLQDPPTWYKATIVKELKGKKYKISWNDGDTQDTIKNLEQIRVLKSDLSSAKTRNRKHKKSQKMMNSRSEGEEEQLEDVVEDTREEMDADKGAFFKSMSDMEEDDDDDDGMVIETSSVRSDPMQDYETEKVNIEDRDWIDNVSHSISQDQILRTFWITLKSCNHTTLRYVLYHMQRECLKFLIQGNVIQGNVFLPQNLNSVLIQHLMYKFRQYNATFDCMKNQHLVLFNQQWPVLMASTELTDFESIVVFALTRLAFESQETANNHRRVWHNKRVKFHLVWAKAKLHESWHHLDTPQRLTLFQRLKNQQFDETKGFYFLTKSIVAPSREEYMQWGMCVTRPESISEIYHVLKSTQEQIVKYVTKKLQTNKKWIPFHDDLPGDLSFMTGDLGKSRNGGNYTLDQFREHYNDPIGLRLKKWSKRIPEQSDPRGACIILILRYLFTKDIDQDNFHFRWNSILARVHEKTNFLKSWTTCSETVAHAKKIGIFTFYGFLYPENNLQAYLRNLFRQSIYRKILIKLQHAILSFQRKNGNDRNIHFTSELSSKLIACTIENKWIEINQEYFIEISQILAHVWYCLIKPSECVSSISAVIFLQVKALLAWIMRSFDADIKQYNYNLNEWDQVNEMHSFFMEHSAYYTSFYPNLIRDRSIDFYREKYAFNLLEDESRRKHLSIIDLEDMNYFDESE